MPAVEPVCIRGGTRCQQTVAPSRQRPSRRPVVTFVDQTMARKWRGIAHHKRSSEPHQPTSLLWMVGFAASDSTMSVRAYLATRPCTQVDSHAVRRALHVMPHTACFRLLACARCWLAGMCTSWSSNGSCIASAYQDGTVAIWDIRSGAVVQVRLPPARLPVARQGVPCVAPAGSKLARL